MNKFIYSGIAALAIFACVGISTAQAAPQPLEGWAWSETIGWVSFSSDNDHDPNMSGTQQSPHDYGVSIDDQTGLFSGYAWSSNIGWVSFEKSDTGSCGSHAELTGVPNPTGEITGYARVLSGTTQATQGNNQAEWTGCLQLSDSTTHPSDPNGGGGVAYNDSTNAFVGYAWGAIGSTGGDGGNDPTGDRFDGVVGWLDFSRVTANLSFTEPTLELSANESSVQPLGPQQIGQWETIKLSWESDDDLTDCEAIETGTANQQAGTDWLDGSIKPDPNDSQSGVEVPNDPTAYQIACVDTTGNTVESNVVKVYHQWPEPQVSISSSHACIPEPGDVTISWDLGYVVLTDCYFPEGDLSPLEAYIGEENVFLPDVGTYTFSVSCEVNNDSFESSVTVDVGGSCAPDDPATSEPGDPRPRFDEI